VTASLQAQQQLATLPHQSIVIQQLGASCDNNVAMRITNKQQQKQQQKQQLKHSHRRRCLSVRTAE
jgi:hypothetical protein